MNCLIPCPSARGAAVPALPRRLLKRGERLLEPDVYLTRVDDAPAVVKDYGRYRRTPLAPLARVLVRREARHLRRLRGWAHAPMLVGVVGGLALAMEFVPGGALGGERRQTTRPSGACAARWRSCMPAASPTTTCTRPT